MESGKHEQQKTVVSNKIKAFLLVKVPMKLASGEKPWQVAAQY